MFTSSAVSYRRLKNLLNGKRIIIMHGEWSATLRLLYNWPNVTVHVLSCPLLPVSPDPVLRVVPGPLLRMACDPVATGPCRSLSRSSRLLSPAQPVPGVFVTTADPGAGAGAVA